MAEYTHMGDLHSMLRFVAYDNWDAARVRQLRDYLRMTQGAFAARLGMRQQRVSDWECGKHQPRGASCALLSALASECGFAPAGRLRHAAAWPARMSGGLHDAVRQH